METSRYCAFWEHCLPLMEKSLADGLTLAGFEVDQIVPRFLPYTMVGSPEYPLWTLSFYLKLPIFWHFFGGQFLIVAKRPFGSAKF